MSAVLPETTGELEECVASVVILFASYRLCIRKFHQDCVRGSNLPLRGASLWRGWRCQDRQPARVLHRATQTHTPLHEQTHHCHICHCHVWTFHCVILRIWSLITQFKIYKLHIIILTLPQEGINNKMLIWYKNECNILTGGRNCAAEYNVQEKQRRQTIISQQRYILRWCD